MKSVFTLTALIFLLKCGLTQKYEPDSAVVFTEEGCKLIDYYFEDSLTYQWNGECRSGWIDGFGDMTKLRRGERFSTLTAHFTKGLAQGDGTYKIHPTNEHYKGNFIDGQLTGQGEYSNDYGDYYKGQIRNFKLHGNGKMIYANGTSFEGKFNVFNIWTGKYTNLQDDISLFYRGSVIDKLPPSMDYNPKIGEQQTEYFDSDWNRCDKKKAAFFRKITYRAPNIPAGKVRDYYIDGTLQNEFLPLYIDYDDDQMTFYGKYKSIYYSQNGKISRICFYDHQSQKIGYEYDFYDSGELFSETHYGNQGLMDGPYREYNKEGNLQGYAKYARGERDNNSYWQITEKGNWIGVFLLDLKNEMERFINPDECADVFKYGDLMCVKIPDKECYYFNAHILELEEGNIFSIQLDVVLDQPDKNNVLGLIFNYEDEKNFSVLKLSGNKLYAITQYRNNIENEIIPWTKLNFKFEKDNLDFRVLLSFLPNECVLEINEIELNRFPFQTFSKMYCGLFSRGKGLSVIRNFGEIVYFDEETSKGYTDFVVAEREGRISESTSENFTGNGSGFLISNDGYIATNYHVIEEAEVIQVEFDFEDGREAFPASVIQVDKDNDLAILKVDLNNRDLQLPYSVNNKLQEVGTKIFALGYPYADVMGNEIKYSDGSINSRTGIQGDVRFYQISAPIQPGNSGGPCFNEKGDLIGVVSMGLNNQMYQNQNVNYVLKISYLEILSSLLPEKSMSSEPKKRQYNSTAAMISDYKKYVPLILTR
jgi:S1-C subfamily serine protease